MEIGFLAMSGIRAHDPELLELGLTLPGFVERSRILEQVLEFANDVPLFEVQITILTAFPGTPLYDRLRAEGRVLEDERWDLCTLFDVNYQPKADERE